MLAGWLESISIPKHILGLAIEWFKHQLLITQSVLPLNKKLFYRKGLYLIKYRATLLIELKSAQQILIIFCYQVSEMLTLIRTATIYTYWTDHKL